MSSMNASRTLLSLLVCILLATGAARAQTTYYVDDDTCPASGSGTQEDPYCSIQTAIAEASPGGGTAVVSPGVYRETIDFMHVPITVKSTHGPEFTTIDATGLGNTAVKCTSGESSDSELDGFTIRGGTGADPDPPGPVRGGGMYINYASSPTIVNCYFLENTATGGGGVTIDSGSPTFRDCRFIRNSASDGGGGAVLNGFGSNSHATFSNCLFSENLAGTAGAIRNYSNGILTVHNCTFSENSATASAGAIADDNSTNTTITNCIFWRNQRDSDGSEGGPYFDQSAQLRDPSMVTFSCIQGLVEDGVFDDGTNIGDDPYFAPEAYYYLSQTASGQPQQSPCVDAGSETAGNLGLDIRTTRTDGVPDAGTVDMGYHYYYGLSSVPTSFDWGFVAMTLLLLTAGTIALMRRHSQPA